MSIPPTLDAAAAARTRWDVVVVGAGPAGALLARQMVASGARVLLVDRQSFPRRKVCGGCLSARTVDRLARAGCGEAVSRLGGPRLRSLRLAGWGRSTDLELPGGLAVSRRAFDAVLVERALDAGVEFLPGHAAALGEATTDARAVELRSRSGERSSLFSASVADASGLGSLLIAGNQPQPPNTTDRIGSGAVIEGQHSGYGPGVVHMAIGHRGYVGVTRVEAGGLSVAAALDAREVRSRGPGSAIRRTLSSAGLPPIADLEAQNWRGTPRLTQRPRRRAARRVFALGDAAGYVEPFTGEGVGWAIDSALLLAPLLGRAAERWSDSLATEWNVTYRSELARSQRVCRSLSWLLRRPRMAKLALDMLRRRPSLGEPVVRRLHGIDLAEEHVAWP